MLNDIDLSRVDLNLLVFFEVVLAEKNVGRAASVLHLSPSAVSHGLARLRRLFHDPLFIRTPKGVVPTARALELAAPVGDILLRARNVIGTTKPFDPATSTRRFVIGAPDASALVVLPQVVAELSRLAPGIDVALTHVLPMNALEALEAREIDLALQPLADIPPRFWSKTLYAEDFVIGARAGHPFLKKPSLKAYCEQRHLVVSVSGDHHGFVDNVLAERGMKRRVAVAVPSFLLALAAVAGTDLVAALPRAVVASHAERFGVVAVESPIPLPPFDFHAVVPKSATSDAGLMWLVQTLERALGAVVRPRLARRRTTASRKRGRE